MGEAKRRKLLDPDYGKLAPNRTIGGHSCSLKTLGSFYKYMFAKYGTGCVVINRIQVRNNKPFAFAAYALADNNNLVAYDKGRLDAIDQSKTIVYIEFLGPDGLSAMVEAPITDAVADQLVYTPDDEEMAIYR